MFFSYGFFSIYKDNHHSFALGKIHWRGFYTCLYLLLSRICKPAINNKAEIINHGEFCLPKSSNCWFECLRFEKTN